MEFKELTTPKQLADKINVSIGTVYNWINSGKIESDELVGNTCFNKDQVNYIIKNKKLLLHAKTKNRKYFKGIKNEKN